MNSDHSIIAVRDVSKRFGDRAAVDGLNLDVPKGLCFGLLGPNGAGKTTTLRMIYGVTRPSSGSIAVFGENIATASRSVRSRLGVTLQDNVLVETLSPAENLRIFGRYHLLRGAKLEGRVGEMLDFLELRSHADAPVVTLSGGFRRRLAIAMSLMNDPELLILDEPTTGLDPAVRLALWARVRALRSAGKTVLITTHYMDEAERLCDRVAIMMSGRRVCEGAPAELIRKHLAREAIEFDCPVEQEHALLEGSEGTKHRLRAGERLMLYADDSAPLVEWIRQRDGGDRRPLIVRPANLEDVFLSVTGTTLEESA